MMTLFDDDQILKAYTKDIEDNATYREARQTAERMIRDGEMPLVQCFFDAHILSRLFLTSIFPVKCFGC